MNRPELLLRLEQNPSQERVMRLHMDNGFEQIFVVANQFAPGVERDKFMYGLAVALSCYVNRPTLEKALNQVTEDMSLSSRTIPRG